MQGTIQRNDFHIELGHRKISKADARALLKWDWVGGRLQGMGKKHFPVLNHTPSGKEVTYLRWGDKNDEENVSVCVNKQYT